VGSQTGPRTGPAREESGSLEGGVRILLAAPLLVVAEILTILLLPSVCCKRLFAHVPNGRLVSAFKGNRMLNWGIGELRPDGVPGSCSRYPKPSQLAPFINARRG
jgi:hypothetical protein